MYLAISYCFCRLDIVAVKANSKSQRGFKIDPVFCKGSSTINAKLMYTASPMACGVTTAFVPEQGFGG